MATQVTGEQVAETANSQEVANAMEDRFAKEFGEPEQAAPTEEVEAPNAEETETAGDGLEEVELEGEVFKVPPKIKEAVIRQSDYTRGKQEVAEKQRTIDLQAQAFQLQQAEQSFQGTISEQLSNLALIDARTKDLLANWQQLTTDQKQEVLFLDKQRDQITRDIHGKRQEFDSKQQAAQRELLAKTAEAVRKAIPGWSEELAKEITRHAVSDGYTQQELSSVTDPRYIKTLWKAREYDRLQARAKAPAQGKAPAVVKPGASNPMPQAVKNKHAFKKEMSKATSDSAKARLIEDRLAASFK